MPHNYAQVERVVAEIDFRKTHHTRSYKRANKPAPQPVPAVSRRWEEHRQSAASKPRARMTKAEARYKPPPAQAPHKPPPQEAEAKAKAGAYIH